MSADADDYSAIERQLRDASGFEAPKRAVAANSPSTRAAAVIRDPVPLHECPPPSGVTITSPLADGPLPAGSVICGPVTTCSKVREFLEDGAGWIVRNSGGSLDPVPVVTGRYYGGHSQLAIIAEMSMLRGDVSEDAGGVR